ncbi:MAG: biotin/lipoyl-containing protein [Pseudomonadota bacterium]
MATEIVVPQLGTEIKEAEVSEWLFSAGDSVTAGEPMLILTTTKASVEVEAPTSGTLSEIRVEEGDLADVGAVLGVID